MKKFDVIAIGNAILDVLSKVEDNFLKENKIDKGTMTLIDESQAEFLYACAKNTREVSGGSAANTLVGLANLGAKCAFIGKVRNDQLGQIFRHDLTSLGIKFETENAFTGPATARSFIFVTPDAQRSMCTYLGAANKILTSDIDKEQIKQAKILYIEGYLWDLPDTVKAIKDAILFARSHDIKIAFTLSDEFCVNRFRDEFLELIEKDVDILFANEAEVKSLFLTDDFAGAMGKLEELVKDREAVCAVTRGADGAHAFRGADKAILEAEKIDNLIDTTGAGDLFAAGFLYGLSQEKSLKECLKLGNEQAAKIIQQVGARISGF